MATFFDGVKTAIWGRKFHSEPWLGTHWRTCWHRESASCLPFLCHFNLSETNGFQWYLNSCKRSRDPFGLEAGGFRVLMCDFDI